MFLYNYFNPHFRKGSDGDLQSATNIIAISIHTSAREVTEYMIVHPKREWISIHTSAREVTACAVMAYVDTNDFNPHFRKGSDQSSRSHI